MRESTVVKTTILAFWAALGWQCAPAPRPAASAASAPPAAATTASAPPASAAAPAAIGAAPTAGDELTLRAAAEPAALPEPPPPDRPHTRFPQGQGRPCFGSCEGGMVCVRYFAGTGPIGPTLQTCEYPCDRGACPEGQRCTVLLGGPSRACRPSAD